MNAFQSIQDAKPKDGGRITIEIEREQDRLDLDDLPAISGFKVTDNGIGFNDENFDSFNTAFSEFKVSRGGKGLGRFIWLVAFDRVEIDSAFTEPDAATPLQRSFVFDTEYDPDNALPSPARRASLGTVVRLIGFKEPYRSTCPQSAELIAQRIIEHFLLMFLQGQTARVELLDLGQRLVLNEIFESNFKAAASAHRFDVRGVPFTVHGFRLTMPRAAKHKLLYAANYRGVVSENLEQYIPNLSGRLTDEDDQSFVYLAIVQSPYLDQRVNNVRTSFDIAQAEAEEDQQSLFSDEVRFAEIREACIAYVNEDLFSILGSINAAKAERLMRYVQDEAPQYKILMKYREEFIGSIAPDATRADMDAALHRELHSREVKLKQEGSKIIKEAEKIEDYESYQERLSNFMEKYNELGVSALAQYVAHRRIILDFMDRAISRNPESGTYPLEEIVHNLIFPMQTTSEDTPYYQQNLWLIDERLTYHSFLASDRPLKSLSPEFESDSRKRPDLFIFDRKVAFSEGEQPIASIVTIEFKRPQRDDYRPDDNPLRQSFEMIEEIRKGTFRDQKGRHIAVATNNIPAHSYVICDLTRTMKKILLDVDAYLMPDQQGYYGFHRGHNTYFEVIDYNKLVRDAKKRNRIFFDKLNVLGNT